MTTHVPLREIKDDDWNEGLEPEERMPPVDELIAAAERGDAHATEHYMDVVVALGDSAVDDLDFHIRAIETCNGLPQFPERARHAAFTALVRIDSERSARAAAAALADDEPATWFYEWALRTTQAEPSVHLPAALRRQYRDATTPEQRENMCAALSGHPERSPETLAILVEFLQESLVLGAAFLAEYGDEAALPSLLETFDRLPEELTADDHPTGTALYDVVDAIETLGGSLDAARTAKAETIDRAVTREMDALRRLNEAPAARDPAAPVPARTRGVAPVPPRTPARAIPRPGPNQPCACGSGKKSKKCCGG